MRNVNVIQPAPGFIPNLYSCEELGERNGSNLSFCITHKFMLRWLAQILQTINKMFIAYLRIIFHKFSMPFIVLLMSLYTRLTADAKWALVTSSSTSLNVNVELTIKDYMSIYFPDYPHNARYDIPQTSLAIWRLLCTFLWGSTCVVGPKLSWTLERESYS